MGLLPWLESKLFLGTVLRDYGVIEERQEGIARTRISVLLCRKRDQTKLVIRHSVVAWLGSASGTPS